jgi:anaphase-promoting complex subunit 8
MAASTSVAVVSVTAAAVPDLSTNADFSDLREIKKQLLLIAGLTRERGLLHSSKW